MRRRHIVFGTRGSPLALAQAREAVSRAADCGRFNAGDLEIRIIKTTGDLKSVPRVSEIGGKGVFCRELEQALLDGKIDIAVHSMKDLPVGQPEGLAADCVLPRADPRDALICDSAASICALADGSRVGTSSLRRSAQILRLNPKLKPVNFRGNLDTRLRNLDNGAADAAILAMSGLIRLGRMSRRISPVPVSDMLPAPAQGAVCLERRTDDRAAGALALTLNDPESRCRVSAERALLSGLGGDCATPVGALAEIDGDEIFIRGEYLSPDGTVCISKSLRGSVADAVELGLELARRILAEAGASGRRPDSRR